MDRRSIETNIINVQSRSQVEIESPHDTQDIRNLMMSLNEQSKFQNKDDDFNIQKNDTPSSNFLGISNNYDIESNTFRFKSINQSNMEKIDEELEQKNDNVEEVLQNDNLDQTRGDNPQNDEKDDKNKSGKAQGLRRVSTTANLLEDEYFGEDSSTKEKKRNKFINPDMFSKLRDHHVDWDTKVFIEIFWYHILNYLFVGPFINLIYYNKRVLMRNLQFWGLTRAFFIQTVVFIFNVMILTLYFSSSSQNIYLVEIIFTIMILVLRCYIISCKYATLHPDKIKLYRDYVLDPNLTVTDYYLTNWIQQDDQTLYRETYNALQRGEFDPAMFYISFFVEPSKEAAEEMKQLNENIGKHHKYTTVKYQPNCIFPIQTTQYFYGYSVLGYIIRQFNKTNGRQRQVLYSFSLSILRTLIPIGYRYVYSEKFKFSGLEITQLVALSLNNFLGYFLSFIFLFFYIRDMRLKDYILTQCKLILQVKKLHLSEKKILPTIDITNPYSLKGWSILRRISLDYGKQYVLRLQSYLTIYFFTIFFTSLILILWVLRVYDLDSIYPIMCLFELIITFSLLLYILFWGCLLNECFTYYKNTLGDHRVLFLDMMRMKSVYFNEQNFSATNFVLKKSLTKIQQVLGLKGEYKEEQINEYLTQLMSSISDCENELEQDFRNQPFAIYGIKMTLPLFQKFCVGILTIAAGFIQIFLFMNKTVSINS